jgi:peptide/nickel transport system permease protein
VTEINTFQIDVDIEPIAPKKPFGLLFWFSVGLIGLVVFGAFFGQWLGLPDPLYQNYFAINSGPSAQHLFGTDDLGRDLFARTVLGARVSLMASVGSMTIGFGIGVPLAMLAAYRRGRFDALLTASMYSLLAFPAIIANIAVLSFWMPRALWKLIVVIGVASIPLVYRVIRNSTLAVATKEYVTAAKVQGATDRRILLRELLPNVFPIALSFLMIGLAQIIVLEGSLAFLGLSVMPPTPSWGNMINEGRPILQDNPWIVIWPSLAMCLFLLSLNFVGERLRSRLDVSEIKL